MPSCVVQQKDKWYIIVSLYFCASIISKGRTDSIMGKTITEQIDELYEEFRGLPSERPIVRNAVRNDAFAVYVLKTLYASRFSLEFTKNNISSIASYIPAPPDNGIDIFVEETNGDDSRFDIIQVKRSELDMPTLSACFSYMKKTVKDYCKDPTLVNSISCREILSNSALDNSNKKNCHYYVVHTGETHGSISDKDDETVLNLTDLEIIMNSEKDRVKKEIIKFPSYKAVLEFGDQNAQKSAYVCSIKCIDLAILETKYYSTEIGRNILFGHNLRESLKTKTSKSYEGMVRTIKNEPENFWYYNNGITIVADKVSAEDTSGLYSLTIEDFSIVNGAQTTSALGLIYRQAKRDNDLKTLEDLSKAYVIARILKVDDEKTQHSISIYNNTQNPINSRDMVANNPEQVILHEKLLNNEEYPQIFMEIRRGSKLPQTFNKLFAHRITTNEELAQLAYAGFLLKPFTAKDKKASIFNPDSSQGEYNLNEIYHKVFNLDPSNPEKNGILQSKSKIEIDELLFVLQLYKDCKTYLRRLYQDRVHKLDESLVSATTEAKEEIERKKVAYSQILDTIGVCMVYFVTSYYEFNLEFGADFNGRRYDYDRYYSDKNYKKEMVGSFAEFLLSETVTILITTAEANNKQSNMNNWVRGKACEEAFKAELVKKIANEIKMERLYKEVMEKYKTVNYSS